MKRTMLLMALFGLLTSGVGAQTIKSGITNFSVDGHERSMNVGSASNEPDLYFIGEASTKLKDTVLVSDEIVKYTEQKLKDFLGHDLVPVDLKRPSTVPEQMEGKLWVMETITDKKAFKQLNYDEVIEIQCRIGSAGKSGKYIKPFVEVFVKITNKDGKTTFRKREKIKPDDKILASTIELNEGGLGIGSLFKKETSAERGGIPSIQLLDWYKQALDNVFIK